MEGSKPKKPTTTEPDLFHTLMRFHREIALPDMERLIEKQTKHMNERFDHVDTLFARLFARFDRQEASLYRSTQD